MPQKLPYRTKLQQTKVMKILLPAKKLSTKLRKSYWPFYSGKHFRFSFLIIFSHKPSRKLTSTQIDHFFWTWCIFHVTDAPLLLIRKTLWKLFSKKVHLSFFAEKMVTPFFFWKSVPLIKPGPYPFIYNSADTTAEIACCCRKLFRPKDLFTQNFVRWSFIR